MDAATLHELVAAVAAIDGVSVARWGDKANWRIDFKAHATPAEREAAARVVARFDPQAGTPEAVRAEARRRILARYPDWKQAEMTARAFALVLKAAQDQALDAAEMDEIATLRAAWSWIGAAHRACAALEALDPIPSDIADDSRWAP
jgi:hypothetical protein